MKCCYCGNNFRGLIKKEGTKVSEEGICPACKLLTTQAIHGRLVEGSTDEGNSLLPPLVEWQMSSLNGLPCRDTRNSEGKLLRLFYSRGIYETETD